MQAEGNGIAHPWDALYKRDPLLLIHVHDATIQVLDLSDCALTTLPPSLANLSDLRSLDLSRNAFVTLPTLLARLPALQALSLAGNPLAPHLAALHAKVIAALCTHKHVAC